MLLNEALGCYCYIEARRHSAVATALHRYGASFPLFNVLHRRCSTPMRFMWVHTAVNDLSACKLLDRVAIFFRRLRDLASHVRGAYHQHVILDSPPAVRHARLGSVRIRLAHPPASVGKIDVIMAWRTPRSNQQGWLACLRSATSNENKMSDGHRERGSLEVEGH
jgi:hypothetical protein